MHLHIGVVQRAVAHNVALLPVEAGRGRPEKPKPCSLIRNRPGQAPLPPDPDECVPEVDSCVCGSQMDVVVWCGGGWGAQRHRQVPCRAIPSQATLVWFLSVEPNDAFNPQVCTAGERVYICVCVCLCTVLETLLGLRRHKAACSLK